jgi:hypothetical protein
MQRLPTDAAVPIAIWPYNQGDAFFSDARHARLQELKTPQQGVSDEGRACALQTDRDAEP